LKPEPKKGEFSDEYGMYVEEDFHIVTQLPSNRYLDLIGNNVVIKTPNGFSSQVWFFDYKTKTIKSKRSTNMSLDIRSANNLIVSGTNSQWYQVFKYENEMFRNLNTNKVLDVAAGKDAEGTNVMSYTVRNVAGQKWKIAYLSKKVIDQKEGLNKNRGLYINRPFYIVSKLWMSRVITVAGGKNLVIQSRTDSKDQQWFYDQTTKTIKSVSNKDKSLDIRGGNAYAYTTDARWYQLFRFDNGHVINERGQVLAVQSKLDYQNR